MERRDEGKTYCQAHFSLAAFGDFRAKAKWKVDTTKPIFEILLVLCFDSA